MEQKQFPRFNRQEADVIAAKMKEMLGPEAAAVVERSGLNANQMIRFMYIGSMCRSNRERKALDLKSISKQLKIPQYRLKAVEASDVGGVLPEVLEQYADFLGVGEVVEVWKEENEDIWDFISGNPA